jgi:predicted nucleotidyltransferase
MFINQNLEADYKVELIMLLKEYVDRFAWDYTEIPGLSPELVEHQLPIKKGFRTFKQNPHLFNSTIYDRIKEEINRLLQVGFIQPCRYAEWVSNIVPIEKKDSGKIRVCFDFRYLNRATPKDEYAMPIVDMLINDASGHRVISFFDGNAGYNQIFMAKEDMSKTVFICPGFVGLFEWVVMTFGLKNASATYKRVMNLIFHDLIGVIIEVYIDDIMIKSAIHKSYLADLGLTFERMCRYALEMNPLKCAFGVSVGKFLDFIIHDKGIEVDPKRIEKIKGVQTPTYKKDLQKVLGKVNYLRRFITNLSEKIIPFTPILKLKDESKFIWEAKQQEAFEKIKEYLSTPPVLCAPRRGVPFKFYIAAKDRVIGAVLTQEDEGKEYVIAYLVRHLLDPETMYAHIEKLCLSLYYACAKMMHYLLSSTCVVACQTDIIKHMVYRPILHGRIGK